MTEEIGSILSRGFNTFTRNLNITIPFILNMILSGIIFILGLTAFTAMFVMPALPSEGLGQANVNVEQVMDILSSVFIENLWIVIAGILILVLLITFVQSYFTAGAIGMSKSATENGNTDIGKMFSYGRENVVNMFFLKILMGLITFAGIIFLVPGFLSVEDLDLLISNPQMATGSTVMLFAGFLAWMLYIVAISIVLAFTEYALIVDKLDPVSSIEEGFNKFTKNKLDVFLLWLVLLAISILMGIIGEFIGITEITTIAWGFINLILSIIIIPALETIWWTRLYMDKTGKDIYKPEELINY
ncbi:hypothetical protein [Methanohalobium sp.]|uniref:DUF7847 domain-containing protein n=1 Tax=Methanohalobium sp. TaxID=2837493 RepID=UPI0025FB9DA6|nr:hypothetical protein [Methanohalobium sp.]